MLDAGRWLRLSPHLGQNLKPEPATQLALTQCRLALQIRAITIVIGKIDVGLILRSVSRGECNVESDSQIRLWDLFLHS